MSDAVAKYQQFVDEELRKEGLDPTLWDLNIHYERVHDCHVVTVRSEAYASPYYSKAELSCPDPSEVELTPKLAAMQVAAVARCVHHEKEMNDHE